MRPLPGFGLAALATLLASAGLALAFARGPEPSRTGAPAVGGIVGEGLCVGCHSTNPVNVGGKLEILGVPSLYRPDSSYTLTLRLASGQTANSFDRRWGFQLTAVRGDNGEGAGVFELLDVVETQIMAGDSDPFLTRSYAEHTFEGTHLGQASPSQWQVRWTAPSEKPSRIFFFAAGNAANGDAGNTDDWIYTARDTTDIDPTPALQESWGAVKARYRQ